MTQDAADRRAIEERLRAHLDARAATITPATLRPADPPGTGHAARRRPLSRAAPLLAAAACAAAVGWHALVPDGGGSGAGNPPVAPGAPAEVVTPGPDPAAEQAPDPDPTPDPTPGTQETSRSPVPDRPVTVMPTTPAEFERSTTLAPTTGAGDGTPSPERPTGPVDAHRPSGATPAPAGPAEEHDAGSGDGQDDRPR